MEKSMKEKACANFLPHLLTTTGGSFSETQTPVVQ